MVGVLNGRCNRRGHDHCNKSEANQEIEHGQSPEGKTVHVHLQNSAIPSLANAARSGYGANVGWQWPVGNALSGKIKAFAYPKSCRLCAWPVLDVTKKIVCGARHPSFSCPPVLRTTSASAATREPKDERNLKSVPNGPCRNRTHAMRPCAEEVLLGNQHAVSISNDFTVTFMPVSVAKPVRK